MSIKDTVKTWFVNLLDLDEMTNALARERSDRMEEQREYYSGHQKKQLKPKAGKYDDNLTVNLCGLIVDKSVSALVGDPADGHGLTWTFPSEVGSESTPPGIAWLNAQWEANRKDEWLHKNALAGSQTGFPCVKLVPDGEKNIHIVNLDPTTLDVKTDPQDSDRVVKYIISYTVKEGNDDVRYRETTEPNETGTAWTVTTQKREGRQQWQQVGPPVLWEYLFPPILAWQNLPVVDSPYGRSDLDGILPVQDRYNFLISNISKIVRLYAHPQRYTKNLTAQMRANPKTGEQEFVTGPDEMPSYSGDGEIVQLPAVGDLPGAMQLLESLRGTAFALAREVDTQSMKDKVGAITNFALRVLYRDFLDKLGTKRMLYGWAYQELNRRLLILGGFEGEVCVINWPDPLPVNEVEEITALTSDLANGLVSKQTAMEARGYDPEQEAERMSTEKAAGDNAGALLLEGFFNRP